MGQKYKTWTSSKKGKVSSTRVSKLRICTDGKKTKAMGNHYYGDKNHQSKTSYFGKKIAADQIPYIVIPNKDSYKKYKFSAGVILNEKNGEHIYCVVAEVGPKGNGMGEVSIYAAWKLMHKFKKKSHIGNKSQKGKFTIKMFSKSAPNAKKKRAGWKTGKKGLRKQIKKYGKKCFTSTGKCLN